MVSGCIRDQGLGFRVQEFRVVGVLGCRRIGLRIFEVYWAVN